MHIWVEIVPGFEAIARGKQSYYCPECGKSYARNSLTRHIKLAHHNWVPKDHILVQPQGVPAAPPFPLPQPPLIQPPPPEPPLPEPLPLQPPPLPASSSLTAQEEDNDVMMRSVSSLGAPEGVTQPHWSVGDGDFYDDRVTEPGWRPPSPIQGYSPAAVEEEDEDEPMGGSDEEAEEEKVEVENRQQDRDEDYVDDDNSFQPPPHPRTWGETPEVSILLPDELFPYSMAILVPYGAIICLQCRYCIQPGELAGHIKTKHHTTAFTKAVQDEFIRNNGLLEQVDKPDDGVTPIPYLERKSGYCCTICSSKTINRSEASTHAHRVHSLPTKQVMRQAELQTFFADVHSGYIEVKDVPAEDLGRPSDLVQGIMKKLHTHINPNVMAQGDPRKNHPFLQTSGWGNWIGTMAKDQVQEIQDLMKPVYDLDKKCKEVFVFMFSRFNYGNAAVRMRINSPK